MKTDIFDLLQLPESASECEIVTEAALFGHVGNAILDADAAEHDEGYCLMCGARTATGFIDDDGICDECGVPWPSCPVCSCDVVCVECRTRRDS